jgi:hypothetical protein
MSTTTVPEGREGYFPNWKLKTTGVIMPEERLPWGQTIVSGLQHGVAVAGATIIAPLLMGFDPNLALLFSGVGTLIFFVVVAGRVPNYLGSSFSFMAVVIAASGYSGHGPNPNLDVALGGIIAQCLSGAEAEKRVVPWATDGIRYQHPLGERTVVMGALRADREERSTASCQHHRPACDLPQDHSAFGEILERDSAGKVGSQFLFMLAHRCLLLAD